MRRFILFTTMLMISYSLYSSAIKVLFVIGDVAYTYKGNSYMVRTGDTIPLDAVIETGPRSVAVISSDGFNVKLSGDTHLAVKDLFPNTTLNFTRGKIWVKVNKLQTGQSFIVKTPTSNAGVRGTEFIYDIRDKDKLYVIEGKVVFSHKEIERIIHEGEFGLLRGNSIEVKPFTKEDLLMAKLNLPSIIRLKNLKSYWERSSLRKSLYREINLYRRERSFIASKRKNDIATGRVVKDENGNVVRVGQVLRRLSANTLQIVNITQKGDKFMNVVEYRGVYSGNVPTNVSSIMDVISGSDKEIIRTINILQVDKTHLIPYIDRMKIVEEKSNGNKILKMGVRNDLNEPSLTTVTNYTRLKQVDNDPYLSANYTVGANTITLKVFLLKDDGTIVPVSRNADLASDFLTTMSFKFIFESSSISNPDGISFHVLPDIGFMLINNLAK